MSEFPHASQFDSLVGIIDHAAEHYPEDRVMYGLRLDSGMVMSWSAKEMRWRSTLAAWRLRAAGLQPGDRLLTWSPSTPSLPAVYWGAMRAGIVLVPIDLRMTAAVIERIARTYHGWRGERGTGEYEDIPGFCKGATLEEIRKHGHVLTPGRYVGAEAQEDDGEPFEEKMARLAATLEEQFAEGARLEAAIHKNLEVLGFAGGGRR